jgi:hypothetical protein
MSRLIQRTSNGDFVAATPLPSFLKSAYLSAGSTNSSAEIKDGSSGATLLKLTALANGDGAYWASTDKRGVQFSTALSLANLTGTAAAVSVEID